MRTPTGQTFLHLLIIIMTILSSALSDEKQVAENCSGSGVTCTSRKAAEYSLVPGISLVPSENTSALSGQILADLSQSRSKGNELESLVNAVGKYLGSLTLRIRLGDSGLLETLKNFGLSIWSGRGRKGGWHAFGSIAAVGFATMAALSGKALMAALLALMMSGMNFLRGGYHPDVHPNKITQYEIIKYPHHPFPSAPSHFHDYDQYSAPHSHAKRALFRKLERPGVA